MVVSTAFARTIGSSLLLHGLLFQKAGNGMLVYSAIFALNTISTTARFTRTKWTGGGGYTDLGKIFVRQLVIIDGGQ